MEHKHQPLATRNTYLKRLATTLCYAIIILMLFIWIGSLGYHIWGHLNWIDAFYNASMILSGMGPVDTLTNDTAKIFASCYATSSGVIFIGLTGMILSPIFHRIMHRLHLEEN
jgi:hypothetical protein